MKRISVAGSLCAGLLLSACGGSDSSAPAPVVTQPAASRSELLRADLDAFRAKTGLPGLSVVVVDGERIDAVTSGVRRADKAGAVQPGDQFHIGSMTKAVTATLLARLVEDGKLRYDATLGQLFPDWRAGMHPAWRNVTVAQLLRHRAGMKRDIDEEDIAALLPQASGDIQADRAVMGRYLLGQAPALAPDTAYSYSNLGYVILGLVAQAAGGDTWERLLERQVLAPLGIQAGMGLALDASQSALAGHIPAGAGWQVAPDYPTDRLLLDVEAPAGGLKLDMANYGIYLREQLRGLDGNSTLLRQASWTQMHTPVDGAGFGWFVREHPVLGKVSVHDGSIGTYYAMTIVLPERKRAVAIACNCNSDAAVDQIEAYLVSLAAQGR